MQLDKSIIGFAPKKYNAHYSLASVVANILADGVFITDKFELNVQNNIEEKLYWVCFFKHKKVKNKG